MDMQAKGRLEAAPIRLCVLVSGSGTNLQAIMRGIVGGALNARIEAVISNRDDAYALERAKSAGIPTHCVGAATFPDVSERTRALQSLLHRYNPELIVLAGYLPILPEPIVQAFPHAIINIHPALIPKYCGKGFYGMRVHEAVIAAGERESGATVHRVDAGIDTGEILAQRRVPVLEGETPQSLARKVLEIEHALLVETIAAIERARPPRE